MTFKKVITSCSIIALISGASLPARADNILGTVIGAAGGAAVGSNVGKGKGRIAAIAIGTLLGAGIGNSISGGNVYAASYHPGHHYHYQQPYYVYNSYNPYYYNNPTVYHSYWVPPVYEPQPQVVQVNNYQAEPQPQAPQAQEYCREFNQSVTIGGVVQPGYGIACLQPDGSWKMKK